MLRLVGLAQAIRHHARRGSQDRCCGIGCRCSSIGRWLCGAARWQRLQPRLHRPVCCQADRSRPPVHLPAHTLVPGCHRLRSASVWAGAWASTCQCWPASATTGRVPARGLGNTTRGAPHPASSQWFAGRTSGRSGSAWTFARGARQRMMAKAAQHVLGVGVRIDDLHAAPRHMAQVSHCRSAVTRTAVVRARREPAPARASAHHGGSVQDLAAPGWAGDTRRGDRLHVHGQGGRRCCLGRHQHGCHWQADSSTGTVQPCGHCSHWRVEVGARGLANVWPAHGAWRVHRIMAAVYPLQTDGGCCCVWWRVLACGGACPAAHAGAARWRRRNNGIEAACKCGSGGWEAWLGGCSASVAG